MAENHELNTPLTESLESDLLLLSSFLSRQQHSPSQSHPSNDNLSLVSCLSCLLAIGNKRNPKALNVNAVAGSFTETVTANRTINTLEYLVCTENGRQDTQTSRGCPRVKKPFTVDEIVPDPSNGHILLHGWDPANLKGSSDSKK